MALLFIEGFDGGYIPGTWTSSGSGIYYPTGRLGSGYALHIADGSAQRVFPGGYRATVGVGFACKPISYNGRIVNIDRVSDGHGYFSLDFVQGSNYTYSHLNGTYGTKTGSIAVTGTMNAWHYWEVTYNYALAGSVTIKCDGTTRYTYSGDTQWPDLAPDMMPQRLVLWSSATERAFDDVYVTDDATTLGDRQVLTLVPTSDSLQQWTPSTGVNHYAVVDELPPSTTDYVSTTSATNNTDTFLVTVPGTIVGNCDAVQVTAQARRMQSGIGNLAILADGQQSASIALSTSYIEYDAIYPTAASSALWTPAKLASATYGVKAIP